MKEKREYQTMNIKPLYTKFEELVQWSFLRMDCSDLGLTGFIKISEVEERVYVDGSGEIQSYKRQHHQRIQQEARTHTEWKKTIRDMAKHVYGIELIATQNTANMKNYILKLRGIIKGLEQPLTSSTHPTPASLSVSLLLPPTHEIHLLLARLALYSRDE
jgi:hypothetical protein